MNISIKRWNVLEDGNLDIELDTNKGLIDLEVIDFKVNLLNGSGEFNEEEKEHIKKFILNWDLRKKPKCYRNFSFESKIRSYLFRGDLDRHIEVCKSLNVVESTEATRKARGDKNIIKATKVYGLDNGQIKVYFERGGKKGYFYYDLVSQDKGIMEIQTSWEFNEDIYKEIDDWVEEHIVIKSDYKIKYNGELIYQDE